MTTEEIIVDRETLIEMFRYVYKIRIFENRCIELYREGLIRGYLHPYLGEEAIAAGVSAAIGPSAYIVSNHRGHGHCISKGAELKYMFAEIMGKETGYCKGRGGSMHIANLDDNNLGANGIVGATIPIAAGAALGIKLKKTNQVSVAYFSDGGAHGGAFAETMNLAGIFKLPMIFILENNHYSVSTPVSEASVVQDLANRALGYGVPNSIVDGNDAVAVYIETKKAVNRALTGDGPTLIEAKTFRKAGHHVNDPGLYMDKEVLAEWEKKDPVQRLKDRLDDPVLVEKIEKELEVELKEAVEFAKNSPSPEPEMFLAEIENY